MTMPKLIAEIDRLRAELAVANPFGAHGAQRAQRIRELKAERDEARSERDQACAALAEIDSLITQLAKAIGVKP